MTLLTRIIGVPDPLDAEIAALGKSASAGDRLGVIGAHVRRCLRCGLHRTRMHAVPGEGSPAARLMIVGEGPGKTEDELGSPFAGRSGKLLDIVLEDASIGRPEIFITNIVKCRSANIVGGLLRNRPPLMREIGACRPYLVRQVEIIQPLVILCLGTSAARGIINARFNITGQRGRWYQGPYGSKVMATFHPAFMGRGSAKLSQKELKRLVRSDLKRVTDTLR